MPAHLVGVGVPDDPLLPCGGMGHAALHAAIRSYVGRGALTPPQAYTLPVRFRGVEDAAPYKHCCSNQNTSLKKQQKSLDIPPKIR